ncbi:MAG: hypothetical protein WA921_13605 [Ahrensia sp.]
MSKFIWHDDAPRYVLPLVDGKPPIQIIDGYSQWVLGPGAAFNPSEEFRGGVDDPSDDFRFFSTLDLDTQSIGPVTGRANEAQPDTQPSIKFNFLRSLPSQNVALPEAEKSIVGTSPDPSELVLFAARLPISVRSVPSKETPTKPKSYELPAAEMEQPKAIVAFIDDSLNVVRDTFLTRKKTGALASRFDYFWHQDGIAPDNDSTVGFGREILREDIDQVINGASPFDEMAALRALGLVHADPAHGAPHPLDLSVSHGTFVADIAAGYDPADPAGHAVRLIGVQLPILASQDTSGLSLIAGCVSALDYIFSRAALIAQAIGRPLPVVLNFSYGLMSGPRNGGSIIERAIIARAQRYRNQMVTEKLAKVPDDAIVQITVPAGNSHLSQGHVRSEAANSDGDSISLQTALHLQPADRTSTYVEFWFPEGADKLKLSIGLPNENAQDFEIDLSAGEFAQTLFDEAIGERNSEVSSEEFDIYAAVVARVKTDTLEAEGRSPDAPPSANRRRLTLCIAPTAHHLDGRARAPAGRWHIRLQSEMPKDGQFVGYVLRDESVSGFGRRGRQAYFDDDRYTESRFDALGDSAVDDQGDSAVVRDGTISGMATLRSDPTTTLNAFVAGGFEQASGAGAAYSSASDPGHSQVDVALPVESSRFLIGRLGAGVRSGSTRILNGTSIAAPQLVRFVLEQLLASPPEKLAQFNASQAIANAVEPDSVLNENQRESRHSPMRRERSRLGRLTVQSLSERKLDRRLASRLVP